MPYSGPEGLESEVAYHHACIMEVLGLKAESN